MSIRTQPLAQFVHPRGSATVNLWEAFHDSEAGQRLQAGFFPLNSQIQALRTAAETARHGGVCLLVGPPGTGKSLLALLLGRALTAEFPGWGFTELCDGVGDAGVVRSLGAARRPGERWLVVPVVPLPREAFDAAVRRSLSGTLPAQGVGDFVPTPRPRLRDEVGETIGHLRGRGGFQGVAVLFDGFDPFADTLARRPDSPVAEGIRDFAAFCQESSFPVLFCGVVDRDPGLFTVEEEARLLQAIPRIRPVTLLGDREEWADLVARAFLTHPQGAEWSQLLEHPDLKRLRESLRRTRLFAGNSERWRRETVVEGCYPLHPATVFCLPRVALRLAAPGRTAFTFFTDLSPGGLLHFLNHFAVTQPNGRLSLYTADSLFTYFERALREDPVYADYLAVLEKAQMVAGSLPQGSRLMRLAAIFTMAGDERLGFGADELIWALHLGEREAQAARETLQALAEKGVLRHDPATGEFRLPVERARVTLEEALSRVRNRLWAEFNLTAFLQRRFPPPHIPTPRFNRAYRTDRRVFGRYFRVAELLEGTPVREVLERLVLRPRPYQGDLLVAYAVEGEPEERERLRQRCRQGELQDPRLVVALPREPRNFREEALEALSLEGLPSWGPPFSDPTSPERRRLDRALAEVRGRLRRAVEELLDPRNLEFHHLGRVHRELDRTGLRDYLDRHLLEMLEGPVVLDEPRLTTLADPGSYRRQRQQAVTWLVGCRGPVALWDDLDPPQRVLLVGLVESGILVRVGREGVWDFYDLAPAVPGHGLGAAFQELRRRVVGEGKGQRWLQPRELVRLLLTRYRLTPPMVELLFAVLFWKWHRELRLYSGNRRAEAEHRPDLLQPAAPSGETLYALVGDPGDWALEFVEAEPARRGFLEELGRRFGPLRGDGSIWEEAAGRLLAWFDALPEAARRLGREEALVRLLADGEARSDPRGLLESRLPPVLGAPPIFSWAAESEAMLGALDRIRRSLEGVVPDLEQRLAASLRALFPPAGDGDTWAHRMFQWFAGLPEEVLLEEGRVGGLMSAAATGSLDALLEELGYPPLSRWGADHVEEVVEQVARERDQAAWRDFLGLYPLRRDPEGVRDFLRAVIRGAARR